MEHNNLQSPLKLVDFQVLSSHFSFIPPRSENDEINERLLMEGYDLDTDYVVQEQGDGHLLFFMIFGVNHGLKEPEAGYDLQVEMVNVFDVTKVFDKLGKKEGRKAILPSAISIAVNNIRNHFVDVTKRGPFREYLLPALDTSQIIKLASQKRKNEAQKDS